MNSTPENPQKKTINDLQVAIGYCVNTKEAGAWLIKELEATGAKNTYKHKGTDLTAIYFVNNNIINCYTFPLFCYAKKMYGWLLYSLEKLPQDMNGEYGCTLIKSYLPKDTTLVLTEHVEAKFYPSPEVQSGSIGGNTRPVNNIYPAQPAETLEIGGVVHHDNPTLRTLSEQISELKAMVAGLRATINKM